MSIINVRLLTDRGLTFFASEVNYLKKAYAENKPAPRHIGKYVNKLSKDIRYACNSYLVSSGTPITGEQCRLLAYIRGRNEQGECVYQRDIERDFQIKRSSVASILGHLEKGGYIIREIDKDDARIKKVILTESGAELDNALYENILKVEGVISEGMTEEEKDEFLRLLKKAISNIENSSLTTEDMKRSDS